MARTSYDNWKAITHAKTWCRRENNPCGTYLNKPEQHLSDCAHFIAHCLNAGGLLIAHCLNAGGLRINSAANDGLCPDGLSVKNTEIVAALKEAASNLTV
jgi:hypothetical protein